jgi:hypothetical protein
VPKGKSEFMQFRKHVQFISDGAVWTRNLAEEHLTGARILLDWYHASEHVAEAARIAFANEQQASKWRKRVEHLLLEGDTAGALTAISSAAESKKRTAEGRAALLKLHGYLKERKPLLQYARATDAGRHIGSGAVQSAVGYVMQQRMKRAGMRWDRKGAIAMLALRAAHRSTGGWKKVRELA